MYQKQFFKKKFDFHTFIASIYINIIVLFFVNIQLLSDKYFITKRILINIDR